MERMAARSWCVSLALLTCACAMPTRVEDQGVPIADQPFQAAGRLSARYRSEGAAANFRWSHHPGRDELEFASPLGQTLARLSGDSTGVRLALPDGRTRQAEDWEALTSTVIGASLPVRGLAYWIRGAGHPASRYTIERDASARVAVLRQDGWEIVYDYGATAERPSRLRLSYPDTEIRLVVDDWSTP
jgi:outer membrane lipoprotein LolB